MFGKLWNAIMGACETFILKLYPLVPSTDNTAPKVSVEPPQTPPTAPLPTKPINTMLETFCPNCGHKITLTIKDEL